MKTLVVQKMLRYRPETLDYESGSFIREVRQLLREVGEKHREHGLELSDIGFTPETEHIEVKLYFRQPPYPHS